MRDFPTVDGGNAVRQSGRVGTHAASVASDATFGTPATARIDTALPCRPFTCYDPFVLRTVPPRARATRDASPPAGQFILPYVLNAFACWRVDAFRSPYQRRATTDLPFRGTIVATNPASGVCAGPGAVPRRPFGCAHRPVESICPHVPARMPLRSRNRSLDVAFRLDRGRTFRRICHIFGGFAISPEGAIPRRRPSNQTTASPPSVLRRFPPYPRYPGGRPTSRSVQADPPAVRLRAPFVS